VRVFGWFHDVKDTMVMIQDNITSFSADPWQPSEHGRLTYYSKKRMMRVVH
jgi:hypothetical protein